MHARNLAQHPEVDEVTLVGRDSSRLQGANEKVLRSLSPNAPVEFKGEHFQSGPIAEIRSTTDLNLALRESDGVVIASTTATHPELVRRCIELTRPTLVEKPLALDITELRRLADEIERSGTEVMVAFHRKYDTSFQALRDKISSGKAGTVRIVHATSHDHEPLSLDYIPASGGVWRDLMIHDFDLIPWLIGERAVLVQAFASVLDEPSYAKYGDADTAVAILEFESGAIATVSGTRRNGAGHDVRLEVYGTLDTFSVGFDSRAPITSVEKDGFHPTEKYQDFMDRFEPAFRAEVGYFVRLIRGEVPNLTPARDGIDSLQIALAAEDSWKSGKSVSLTH
jgi:myo-inositol 2-dehydrogenase/D-chiro-inositol 1-dehydrogenase